MPSVCRKDDTAGGDLIASQTTVKANGNLIIVSLNSGELFKLEKVARNFISKPYIQGGNLFVVKNGSIIQYD